MAVGTRANRQCALKWLPSKRSPQVSSACIRDCWLERSTSMWEEWLNWIQNQLNKLIIKGLQDNHTHIYSEEVQIIHKYLYSQSVFSSVADPSENYASDLYKCLLTSIWRRMGWDGLKQVCNKTSCRSERNADCPPAAAPPASPQAALRSNQPPVAYPPSHRPQHIGPARNQLASTGDPADPFSVKNLLRSSQMTQWLQWLQWQKWLQWQ